MEGGGGSEGFVKGGSRERLRVEMTSRRGREEGRWREVEGREMEGPSARARYKLPEPLWTLASAEGRTKGKEEWWYELGVDPRVLSFHSEDGLWDFGFQNL